MSTGNVDPAVVYEAISEEVSQVLIGKEEIVEGLAIALFTRGHVLLEGVPGVAKTTIANLVARATGLDYARIQMTPDVLPADVTGTSDALHDVTEGYERAAFAPGVLSEDVATQVVERASGLDG